MNKKVICIIDDDPIYHILINKIIIKSEIDFSVIAFTSGNEALESFKSIVKSNGSLPEIILLDIEMPIMDGWDFMNMIKKDLRQETRATGIYIVSSSISYEDKEKARSFPEILGFFSKPINGDSILKIVENSP